MSSALAIASVTYVLKDLLNNGIIDHDVTSTINSAVTVTALPPDLVNLTDPNQVSRLNLFMYQASPNQGWRNAELPSRDSRGARTSAPPLALDLHYLLTAYGFDELHAEVLLGYGMQLLHETPVITRDAIRKSLVSPEVKVDDTEVHEGETAKVSLPDKLKSLSVSGLADQIEQIKITLQPSSTEEMSKLWSAFQSKYRPTAAYQVSVVLIESSLSTKRALPVLGPRLYVAPFRQPVIDQILSQAKDGDPIVVREPILSGHRLIIEGRTLKGDRTAVKIEGKEVDAAAILGISEQRITLSLPLELRAGIHSLQVAHKMMMGPFNQETEHLGTESTVATFVLSPSAEVSLKSPPIPELVDAVTLYSLDITVAFKPSVGKKQRVVLFLNEYQTTAVSAKAYSFNAPKDNGISDEQQEETNSIKFGVTKVVSGTYFIRVQVDGAESPLDLDPGSPTFGPMVTVP